MFLFMCLRKATGAVFMTMVLLLSAGLSDVMGSSRRRPGSSSSSNSRESPALSSVGGPGEERCPEGWLYSHRFCLLHTGMRDSEAEEVCTQNNALQAQGICIAKPITDDSPLDLLPMDKDDDDWAAFDASPLPNPSSSSTSLLSLGSSSVSSSLTPSSDYECPRGWKQFQNYCIIRPGAAPQICTLLGAHYLFNYCVASLPHQLSMDFVKAANELEGSKSNFLRVARICCCKGSGYCK